MSNVDMTDAELRALNEEFNEAWNKNQKNWEERNSYFTQLSNTTDVAERECIKIKLKRIEQRFRTTETILRILDAMIYPPVEYDDNDDDEDDDYNGRHRAYMGDCC